MIKTCDVVCVYRVSSCFRNRKIASENNNTKAQLNFSIYYIYIVFFTKNSFLIVVAVSKTLLLWKNVSEKICF